MPLVLLWNPPPTTAALVSDLENEDASESDEGCETIPPRLRADPWRAYWPPRRVRDETRRMNCGFVIGDPASTSDTWKRSCSASESNRPGIEPASSVS